MSDETTDQRKERLLRVRKPPPPFRIVRVVERVELSPRLVRLTVDGLSGFELAQPAASVRVVVPWPGERLEVPEWNGNEFLLADDRRPALRTFTPLRADAAAGRLDLEIVRHEGGAVSGWAETAEAGSEAAISGPGAGYDYPDGAERLLVLADETALPAVTQLIEMAPDGLALDVHVEVIAEHATIALPERPGTDVRWHVTAAGERPGGRLVALVQALDELPGTTHIWAAGEASAVQAIRNHLFKVLGVERQRATVRGYWKPAER